MVTEPCEAIRTTSTGSYWELAGTSSEAEELLGTLLAVIHRDLGHYEGEHGTRKAVDDAISLVVQLRVAKEAMETVLDTVKKLCLADTKLISLLDALQEMASRYIGDPEYYAENLVHDLQTLILDAEQEASDE